MSSSHTPTPPPRPTRPLIHWVHWLLIGLVFLLPILVFGFAFSLRFAIPLTLLLLGAAYWQAPQRPSLSTCLWAAGITFFPFILEQAELLPHPSNIRIESPRLIFIRLGLHIFVPLLILTCGLIFWGADAPRVARASKNLRRGHTQSASAHAATASRYSSARATSSNGSPDVARHGDSTAPGRRHQKH